MSDDAFMFFEANKREYLAIKDILRNFYVDSGQMGNFSKSTIEFRKNVAYDDQYWFINILEAYNDNKANFT